MNHILVCIKAVPAAASVQVDGQYRLKRDGVNLQWNIADESALEAAFRLKDKDGTRGSGRDCMIRRIFCVQNYRKILMQLNGKMSSCVPTSGLK